MLCEEERRGQRIDNKQKISKKKKANRWWWWCRHDRQRPGAPTRCTSRPKAPTKFDPSCRALSCSFSPSLFNVSLTLCLFPSYKRAHTHTHLYGSNRIVPESTTTKSTTTELRNGRGNEEKETVYLNT